MLHKAPWEVERLILLAMYDSIGPVTWAAYRRRFVCRIRTQTYTLPPRLNMSVI